MMQQIANHIVDHDPMMVLRRTHDTVRYIQWAWNKDHVDSIDEEELRLLLCDEHYGDLTDEQRAFARQGRDKMRSVYAELCVRLLQSEIMLERGMVPDSGIYRSVFCPEGGDKLNTHRSAIFISCKSVSPFLSIASVIYAEQFGQVKHSVDFKQRLFCVFISWVREIKQNIKVCTNIHIYPSNLLSIVEIDLSKSSKCVF